MELFICNEVNNGYFFYKILAASIVFTNSKHSTIFFKFDVATDLIAYCFFDYKTFLFVNTTG